MNQDHLMDREQFKKKKKRKVRSNKAIRAISSYLCNFIPKKKGLVFRNLNKLFNISDHVETRINPICIYSPYTMKRKRLKTRGQNYGL